MRRRAARAASIALASAAAAGVAAVARPLAAAGPATPPPPEVVPDIDREIDGPYDGGSPFYPSGRFFWITHPRGFGFANDVHVVHWDGLSALDITVKWNGAVVRAGSGRVHASRLELDAGGDGDGVSVHEAKLLTPDDALVSVLKVRARAAGKLAIEARSPLAGKRDPSGTATGSEVLHGIPLDFAFTASVPFAGASLELERELRAGESFELRTAVALAPRGTDARAVARKALLVPDPVAAAAEATERWFVDRAPGFDCPDPVFRRAFLYRLLTIKKDLMDPRWGRLRTVSAAEGRWAARWYAALITFGAGHQLAEMRWLRDPDIAWGHLQAFLANQRGDGAFVGARTDAALTAYQDFIGAGARDLYLATGDRRRFAAAAGALARAVDHTLASDCDGDFLPGPSDHWTSGMEWQAAFFAFDGYDPKKETKLERVESACFLHGNAIAAAEALELAGPAEAARAARYREVAARTAAAVEGELWDAASRFYLSRRESDHRQALDREVVGFYPPAFGITAPARLGYLAAVGDRERWASDWPVPSVEFDSPAFAHDRRWPVGPGGGSASMWNGPTWPHAQSFVIRSLAAGERAGALPGGTAFRLLESYARAHFLGIGNNRDLDKPQIGEMYDPFRGVWLTNEREYFHSTFVDLVVTVLAGVVPAAGDDVLRVDPRLPPGRWDRFALVRLPYHGHTLAIAWDDPGDRDDAYGDGISGLAVWVDGTLSARRDDLGPLDVPLAAR